MPMIFNYELCDGCRTCESICPGDVIYIRPRTELKPNNLGRIPKKEPYLKYPEECWHCGACRQDCEQQAISVQFPPDMLCI